jgi:hypothetical protein
MEPSIKERPSLLSNESEQANYRGFMNLLGIILLVTNARLVMENLLHYGLRLSV